MVQELKQQLAEQERLLRTILGGFSSASTEENIKLEGSSPASISSHSDYGSLGSTTPDIQAMPPRMTEPTIAKKKVQPSRAESPVTLSTTSKTATMQPTTEKVNGHMRAEKVEQALPSKANQSKVKKNGSSSTLGSQDSFDSCLNTEHVPPADFTFSQPSALPPKVSSKSK
jgi:hypothetical protein